MGVLVTHADGDRPGEGVAGAVEADGNATRTAIIHQQRISAPVEATVTRNSATDGDVRVRPVVIQAGHSSVVDGDRSCSQVDGETACGGVVADRQCSSPIEGDAGAGRAEVGVVFDDHYARIDDGAAAVGIGAGQSQHAGAGFGDRPGARESGGDRYIPRVRDGSRRAEGHGAAREGIRRREGQSADGDIGAERDRARRAAEHGRVVVRVVPSHVGIGGAQIPVPDRGVPGSATARARTVAVARDVGRPAVPIQTGGRPSRCHGVGHGREGGLVRRQCRVARLDLVAVNRQRCQAGIRPRRGGDPARVDGGVVGVLEPVLHRRAERVGGGRGRHGDRVSPGWARRDGKGHRVRRRRGAVHYDRERNGGPGADRR